MQDYDWLLEIVESIKEIRKQDEVVTFHFHPMYRAYMGPDSSENIPRIFGASRLARWKRYGRKVRKKNSYPKTFHATLPADSIIFIRPEKKGIIALSAKEDMGLKIFFNDYYTPLLDKEIEALKVVQHLHFTPLVKGHGTTRNKGYWSLTNFCANTDALGLKADAEKFLLKNFMKLVMPGMTGFYQSMTPQKELLSQWLQRAKERANVHSSKSHLMELIAETEAESKAFPDFELLTSNIHFDLHAWNILSDHDQLSIIDWEGGFRGLVFIDFFDFSRRFLISHKWCAFFFKRFLKKKGTYPRALKESFEGFRKWSLEKFAISIPAGAERLMILLYVLERTLILFEERALDRLRDRRAFEFMVFKEMK